MNKPRHFNLRGHTFWGPLTNSDIVLDMGANEGEFGRAIAQAFDATCVSFEPNSALRSKMIVQGKMSVRPEAIGAESGTRLFHVDATNSEASRVLANGASGSDALEGTEEVKILGLADALKFYATTNGRIALVKMDIEGNEREAILASTAEQLRLVDQFTIEFHDHNRMLTKSQVEETLKHLRSSGFRIVKWSTFGHGDVLAYQPKLIEVSAIHKIFSLVRYRVAGGISRRFSRHFS